MRRLVILVPGYQDQVARGTQLQALRNQLEMRGARAASPISRQSFDGFTCRIGDSSIDLFESDWQSSTPLISALGFFYRLGWGFLVLTMWMKPRRLRASARHLSWIIWFALTMALFFLWWVGGMITMVQGIHVVSIGRFGTAVAIGWAIIWAVLVAFGVSVDASVNVADLFRRYLTNKNDYNGVDTRWLLRRTVERAIESLADESYDEVVVVACSFGVLLTIDAIANGLPRAVHFISLGGFLGFLAAEEPWVFRRINVCLKSSSLLSWNDYYSSEDMFASAPPLANSNRYRCHPISLRATFLQRYTGRSHAMYLQNDVVLEAVMSRAPTANDSAPVKSPFVSTPRDRLDE